MLNLNLLFQRFHQSLDKLLNLINNHEIKSDLQRIQKNPKKNNHLLRVLDYVQVVVDSLVDVDLESGQLVDICILRRFCWWGPIWRGINCRCPGRCCQEISCEAWICNCNFRLDIANYHSKYSNKYIYLYKYLLKYLYNNLYNLLKICSFSFFPYIRGKYPVGPSAGILGWFVGYSESWKYWYCAVWICTWFRRGRVLLSRWSSKSIYHK